MRLLALVYLRCLHKDLIKVFFLRSRSETLYSTAKSLAIRMTRKQLNLKHFTGAYKALNETRDEVAAKTINWKCIRAMASERQERSQRVSLLWQDATSNPAAGSVARTGQDV